MDDHQAKNQQRIIAEVGEVSIALLREVAYCRKRVETLEEQVTTMTANRDRWRDWYLAKAYMIEDVERGVISYDDGEWRVKNIKFDGVTITQYRNGLVIRAHKGG